MRLILLVVLFLSGPAFASDLIFSRNPRTTIEHDSSLVSKGLADACLGLLDVPDGLACNPANSLNVPQSTFGLQFLVSNGYTNLQNVRDLLTGDISQDTVNRLFSNGRFTQIETTGSVIFKSKSISGRYMPISVRGFSIVRNEANPVVQVQFIEEQGFSFQSAVEPVKNLSLGLQARFAQTKTVDRTFQLVELATESGQEILKPREQNSVYLEPGVTWKLGERFSPRLTAFMQNLTVAKSGDSYFAQNPNLQLGSAVTVPVLYGLLDIMLEYRKLESTSPSDEAIHLGSNYKFGAMNLSAGVDGRGLSGGVFYLIDSVSAGILYSTTKTVFDSNNYYTQTVYAQLGWQL